MPRNHVDGGLLTRQVGGPVWVGIDPSLTGFAVTAVGRSGLFESWLYKSPNSGVERLFDIASFLDHKMVFLTEQSYTIEDVAIEDTVVSSYASVSMGELSATVRLMLNQNYQSKPLKVPPTMVKKFATGKGNAKKNEVMLGVYKQWNAEFADDNMADSFVIAMIARGQSKNAYQEDVLYKLSDPKFRDPGRV